MANVVYYPGQHPTEGIDNANQNDSGLGLWWTRRQCAPPIPARRSRRGYLRPVTRQRYGRP